MPRRDNPILPGQQLEPWTLRREPFASVQEQEWAAVTAFHQLQGRPRNRHRLGHLIFPVVGPSMRLSIIADACGGFQAALNRARGGNLQGVSSAVNDRYDPRYRYYRVRLPSLGGIINSSAGSTSSASASLAI